MDDKPEPETFSALFDPLPPVDFSAIERRVVARQQRYRNEVAHGVRAPRPFQNFANAWGSSIDGLQRRVSAALAVPPHLLEAPMSMSKSMAHILRFDVPLTVRPDYTMMLRDFDG